MGAFADPCLLPACFPADTCAINLAGSVLSSGASRQTSARRKAVPVPPASHIALLATLTVHPLHTSRVEKPDHLDVSSLALQYLRGLLAIVGPLNADFRTAFQFHQVSRSGRRSGYHSHGNNSDASDGESDPDDDRVSGRLANQSSLWTKGHDFWSVLGWALNCSTLYPHRWRYWKTWLEFMVDVMESDWDERERLDLEAHEASGGGIADDAPTVSRQDSIISMYWAQQDARRGSFKTIIKALLADGGSFSSSSFPEIFEKEPRGPKKHSKKRKRETLDLENNVFGDYFEDESISSGASEPPTPEKPRDPRKVPFGTSHPGLSESINLRMRLFKLLSLAIHTLGKQEDIPRLYEEFAAAVKLLPLDMFNLVTSQRPSPVLAETHVTVLKELFYHLLPASYKDPAKVDPDAEAEGALTRLMLEECFVPHPANTVAIEDNAKLALVVESAVQLLWTIDVFEYSDNFAQAVEKGIKARENKTKKRRNGKAKLDANDIQAQDVLDNSTERLRLLMQAMEATSRTEA